MNSSFSTESTDLCVNHFRSIYGDHGELSPEWHASTMIQWLDYGILINRGIIDQSPVLIPDTDMLLFWEVHPDFNEHWKYYDIGTCQLPDGCYQAPILFNHGELLEFSKFVTDHVKARSSWLINTMCLTLWYHRLLGKSVAVMNTINKGAALDYNISLSECLYELTHEGEETTGGFKKIEFVNGIPHCRNNRTKELVRFKLLHFWYYYKNHMEEFYRRTVISQ
jgi:hypothetical protein